MYNLIIIFGENLSVIAMLCYFKHKWFNYPYIFLFSGIRFQENCLIKNNLKMKIKKLGSNKKVNKDYQVGCWRFFILISY